MGRKKITEQRLMQLLLKKIPKEDLQRVKGIRTFIRELRKDHTDEECWELLYDYNIQLLRKLSRTREKIYPKKV